MRAALLLLLVAVPLRAAEHTADVVVYGGTAGGCVAAVAAAREGKSVLLLEPGKFIGGMTTGGLGQTDTGNRGAIGGYSREFYNRILAHYTKKYGEKSQQVKDCSGGFRFEPHVALHVLNEMLAEAKVKPMLGQRLSGITKEGTNITSMKTVKGDTFKAKVFIDATYEGDLMAKAGVKYHVGREGREVYGESLAGVQKFSRAHQFHVPVNGLDAKKKPLPFVSGEPPAKPGTGDRKVQAYNFRLCLTDDPKNQLPFAKPEGYDANRFELLLRYLKAKPGLRVKHLMNPIFVPNRKTDTNNNGPFSTDFIGMNYDYPDAGHEKREKIIEQHRLYTMGFLYFLANDPRVPKDTQADVRRWGMARDEWKDNGNWPTQIYVREARRMVGQYVMTEKDLMKERTKADSVGLASYNADSHHCQRVLKADGTVINEGDFQVGVDPYAVPYRAITPKPAECTNLIVPVACSTSHVAYGSVRMEPVFMILGQASGVAAALSIDSMTSVQKVPMEKLLALLKKQKAVLSPDGLPARRTFSRRLDPAKMAGIVVDDVAAKLTGEWKRSSAVGTYVGEGYLHDGDADKGKLAARFVPKLPKAGKYEVRLFFAASSNRTRGALVVIKSKAGEKKLRVDQRAHWDGDNGVPLGTYEFEAGEAGWVEVRNEGTRGHVIADAVQFLPK